MVLVSGHPGGRPGTGPGVYVIDPEFLASLYGARCPGLVRAARRIGEPYSGRPALDLSAEQWLAVYRFVHWGLSWLSQECPDADAAARWLRTRPSCYFRTCRLWLLVWSVWKFPDPPADDVAERLDLNCRYASPVVIADAWADLKAAARIETDWAPAGA